MDTYTRVGYDWGCDDENGIGKIACGLPKFPSATSRHHPLIPSADRIIEQRPVSGSSISTLIDWT